MSDGSSNALVERNFTAKLSCPLVGRALLEYRAFLRAVFFYYAKQDEVAADELAAVEEQALLEELRANGEEANGAGQIEELLVGTTSTASVSLLQPDLSTDFQLEKTKRSSMSFGEFQTFLAAFRLLDKQKVSDDDNRSTSWSGNKVTLSDAQHIFSSVMALDNDDTEQLEFDEFAAAIMALAVYLNPSPFTLWHQKFNEFATGLQKMWDEQELGNH
ncbi:hypothetical protein PHYBOEH_000738 [Phytophthora boehmeriae]|uniref:Uncharacterized protein n=1 Tax=Phytophthora boehmeriae TaxID=109152 RepID=A0A8T1X0H9_9STRA|nr:hypothetical protein PHYBOEH_000738 [Phytophthora boehmeriae]